MHAVVTVHEIRDFIFCFFNHFACCCCNSTAFDGEHCYEPYVPHGNFSSSDITFPIGTTVTFSCSPGFVMEQGSGVMECVDPSDPHWNESEPVCKGITLHNIHNLFAQFSSKR